jgi:hypothetical protein
MVEFVIVELPPAMLMPPPSPVAELPLMVEEVTVRVPLEL